ncbi:hypothetical protein RhiirC2_794204 [Rhizophagus irregularis]|uniref:Uncharacterized protein n=1 Tax=Rhizophagus irregularis TaxID=588596 RepID=A0A2N1ME10_9GLOM|nr:hypothetical protein RhiirC2_794204 [Rhizophagus irregularis]
MEKCYTSIWDLGWDGIWDGREWDGMGWDEILNGRQVYLRWAILEDLNKSYSVQISLSSLSLDLLSDEERPLDNEQAIKTVALG